MPHMHDASRWVENADGSFTRVAEVPGDGENATEGALELAAAYGVDLTAVKGSGAKGRITKADVEAYLEGGE